MLPLEGVVGSAILTFLVLDASRRISGWGFVAIILAIAVYVYISPFMGGDFQTRWVSPERMVAYVGLDVNGMIGNILQVAVLVVIPYTILGQVLARTGGAEFFSDLAMSAMGGFRGGSAKIAVVGSALFGMISGSAVSNVLAVGIVTIPTMIKSGFTRYKAAAIESVGSTGGQLMPPEKAAIASTGLLIVFALIFGYRGKRVTIREILVAVIETGRVSLDIILIGAAAGIMVGIMSISGLAFSMTLQLLALSGDSVFLLLLLIVVLPFVLGIGLPTVSVYILTATLLAPALVKLGVTPMAAHMFVMYNGMLSMITPPVAFAAYAAANIARTDGWTTGWIACLVGWSTFILPFLFVLTPSLLIDGPSYLIAWNFCRILFGLFVGTAAIVGFALTRLTTPARLLYGALSLPIVLPPESFAGGYYVHFAGIAAGIALLVIDHLRRSSATAKVAMKVVTSNREP